jgi:hypothetical protein
MWQGQTARIIEMRCQVHIRHLHHVQAEKSTVAEYLLNTEHEIQFEKTNRLNRTITCTDWSVKKATEQNYIPETLTEKLASC